MVEQTFNEWKKIISKSLPVLQGNACQDHNLCQIWGAPNTNMYGYKPNQFAFQISQKLGFCSQKSPKTDPIIEWKLLTYLAPQNCKYSTDDDNEDID